jgi:hydroxymethylpyrimidine pyrophosphatase-like HAD family hydrolase
MGSTVAKLSEQISSLAPRPLYAVGSGGSLTTAEIAAALYWQFEFGFSSAITPVELLSRSTTLRNSAVLIATAGGSNPDVIGALRIAAHGEAGRVLAVCASLNSRLATEACRFSNVSLFDFALPAGRDGFLASNSLLASAVLLVRAFAESSRAPSRLPKTISSLVRGRQWQPFCRSVEDQASDLWLRNTLVVLFGPSTRPAAVDVESKLTEAALSNCSIADYRHFAHGRHHWFAKNGGASSILAFVSPDIEEIAQKTLAEIPRDIPRLVVDVPEGPEGMLAALAHVFPIVQSAGIARRINPGGPGVPSFGRRIYHLNAFGRHSKPVSNIAEREAVAIERKSGHSIAQLRRNGDLRFWRSSFRNACERILDGRYAAVVFDYDGTLCDASDRFAESCRQSVSDCLTSLLRSGVRVGIATGRGKSVRVALRASIPKNHWKQVVVGYYNGGQIAALTDETLPDGTEKVVPDFENVLRAISRSKRLKRIADIEPRLRQVTVKASQDHRDECWDLLTHALFSSQPQHVKLVCSTHSFDVVPMDVSKLDVLRHVAQGTNQAVLAIGDMGRWPGNDHELLSHPHSLSVHEVSADPETCWNFASPGVCGVDATLEYLARAKVSSTGLLRLALPLRAKGGQA